MFNHRFIIIVSIIVNFLPLLYGQVFPPYKLSRLIDFVYTESISYDNNIYRSEYNEAEDFVFNHQLRISHNDTRPYFNYQLAYGIGYNNYIENRKLDNTSHTLNGAIQIQRPNYNVTLSHVFSISSNPQSLYMEAFTKTRNNTTSMSAQYRLFDRIRFEVGGNYSLIEYPDTDLFNQINWNFNTRATYQAVSDFNFSCSYNRRTQLKDKLEEENIDETFGINGSYQIWTRTFLSVGYNYTKINRTYLNDDKYYSIPFGIRIHLRSQEDAKEDNLKWIQSLIFNFSYSISNRAFDNPIKFAITASGNLGEKTSWSISGSRNLDFSTFSSELQYRTQINFSLAHRFNDLGTQIQVGYEQIEYETQENLNGLSINIAASYPLTKRFSISLRYYFNKRFTDQIGRDFDIHKVTLSTTIPF